jgi:predicted Zn-ribbon and HTH transcriptional regulator
MPVPADTPRLASGEYTEEDLVAAVRSLLLNDPDMGQKTVLKELQQIEQFQSVGLKRVRRVLPIASKPPKPMERRLHTAIDFPGRVVEGASFFIASFPGKFEVELSRLVAAQDVSTACVFFPDDSPFNGSHCVDVDSGSNSCYCHRLYGEPKSWGCLWFDHWRQLLNQALQQGQIPVVVCFDGSGQTFGATYHDEDNELGRYGGRTTSSTVMTTREIKHHGLGYSQTGEVKFLESVYQGNVVWVSIQELKDPGSICPKCASTRIHTQRDTNSFTDKRNDTFHSFIEEARCRDCGQLVFSRSSSECEGTRTPWREVAVDVPNPCPQALYLKQMTQAFSGGACRG